MSPYRKIADLPAAVPVFPLPGAILFPRWELPLNIFEPRYLNMIDDAMRGHRLIGMVQSFGGTRAHPGLADVGCVGRLTRYNETSDGRYLITLSGICRFRIVEELDVRTPYRQVTPDWLPYADDLHESSEVGLPRREELVSALKAYIAAEGLSADWGAVDTAPMETLIHALAAGCPFSPAEKQALLEAPDLAARAAALIALMEMSGSGGGPGAVQ